MFAICVVSPSLGPSVGATGEYGEDLGKDKDEVKEEDEDEELHLNQHHNHDRNK
jgi:hypothetical protein